MLPPGFIIRLHSALIKPILLAGAPRKFAILNGTIFAAMGLGLQLYYLLPIGALLHIGAVLLAKKDPFFFDILMRYVKQRSFYDI